MLLLERDDELTPADHQTHRRYPFAVPDGCTELTIGVRYSPKFLSVGESKTLVRTAVSVQRQHLEARVGETLASRWSAAFDGAELIVPNLLTISLDDAAGRYRGAGHRHSADQELRLRVESASPGLVAGPIPMGEWVLVMSVHTLVSARCQVRIQIGAVTAAIP